VNDTAVEGSHAQAFFFSLPPNTSVEWQKDFGKEYNTPPGFRCQFRPNRFGIREDESVFMDVYLVGNDGSLFQINGGLFGPWEWWYETDIGTATYGTPPARFRGIILRFYFNPQTVSGSAELFLDNLRLVYYNPTAADSVVTLDRFGDADILPPPPPPPPTPIPSVSPSRVNFGEVTLGTTRTEKVWVRNKGTAALTISSVQSSNTAFSVSTEKNTVQPGDSGKVSVTFQPKSQGVTSGNITVICNAATQSVEISGTGIIVSGVEDMENRPARFALEQNYPNPFNPTTTIEFSLPRRSFVTLTVMDALGREIEKLASGTFTAGIHHVEWNASHPAGTYFYRLSTDDFTQTRKMLLLK
jgi:hypothetical protein